MTTYGLNRSYLEQMFVRQKKYDLLVFSKRETPNHAQRITAYMAELGEFVQECKGGWCWWKLTQKPINYDAALEEYVDMLHFALSYILESADYKIPSLAVLIDVTVESLENVETEKDPTEYFKNDFGADISTIVYWMNSEPIASSKKLFLSQLLLMGYRCGWDLKTIYEAYMKKNLINFDRIAQGY